MTEPEWRRANRANWDERVPLHLASKLHYDQRSLRDGTARLGRITSDVLGPIDGLHVLHLQCHFGMDSLILAQQGAYVTGIDFSVPAIEAAIGLAKELGLDGRTSFIVSDVYEADAALGESARFDRVFVSWGALCWLPDLPAWARIVARHLKPGGWLALADAHPAAYVFDDRTASPDGRPGWYAPYLARTPLVEDVGIDYADPDATLTNKRTYEWLHPLSDIVMALIDAGLRLDRLEEHDSVPWQMFGCQELGADGFFRWPDRPWLPLSFSLRASRA